MVTFDWETLIDTSDLENTSFADIFARCATIHKKLSALPREPDAANRILDAALEMLQRCEAMIDTAGLFSDNEDRDDVPTNHIRYLLAPYYRAEIMASTREREPRPRLIALSLATRHYKSFLRRCQQLGFLDAQVSKALDHWESGEKPDPRDERRDKIERRLRESEVERRIASLLEEQARAADGGEAETSGLDEEGERELWSAHVEHATIRSLDSVRVLAQEQEILAMMLRRLDDDPDEAAVQAEREELEAVSRAREAMRARLLQIFGDLQGSAAKRQQLAADVFRPGHILPTISVEQAGMIELREAQERAQQEQEREAQRQLEQAGKTEDEIAEEEVERQRAWDDWKDDHPTGYGNSKLRPCAL